MKTAGLVLGDSGCVALLVAAVFVVASITGPQTEKHEDAALLALWIGCVLITVSSAIVGMWTLAVLCACIGFACWAGRQRLRDNL